MAHPGRSETSPLSPEKEFVTSSRRDHWDRVYTSKGERDVSWFEPLPTVSLAMLDAAGLTSSACIVDIWAAGNHA